MDTNRPTPHRNQARRLKIAAGVMEGKSLAQIGREEGVSRQTISKQLASSDARQIIVALTNREIDRISVLFSDVLRAIGEGLEARRVQIGLLQHLYRHCAAKLNPGGMFLIQ